MKRVIVYCEGQTEETFVKKLMAPMPLFRENGIYLSASSCGGVSKYSIIKRDLTSLCKNDRTAVITTMLDYYGLPQDTPGIKGNDSGGDIYEKVQAIEAAIQEDIGADNLIANLMVHEFEALLFSKPECFSYCGLGDRAIRSLRSIRDGFDSPEHINNSPNTAPSKRILAICPAYAKPLDGYNIAKNIGIDIMRQQCRHFDEWIERLSQL